MTTNMTNTYAPNLDKITESDIQRAIEIDDIDAAVLGLQTIAGIDDGGIASVCFSDIGFDWPTASREQRLDKVRGWLKVEAAYTEDDV
jgi:hypothetical protein